MSLSPATPLKTHGKNSSTLVSETDVTSVWSLLSIPVSVVYALVPPSRSSASPGARVATGRTKARRARDGATARAMPRTRRGAKACDIVVVVVKQSLVNVGGVASMFCNRLTCKTERNERSSKPRRPKPSSASPKFKSEPASSLTPKP